MIVISVVCQLLKPEWKPDYGPTEFIPHWGATIAGARKFLIAYNINMLSTKEQAHRIALDIREQGRGPNEVIRIFFRLSSGYQIEFNRSHHLTLVSSALFMIF